MTSQPQEPIKFVKAPPHRTTTTRAKWASVAEQLRGRPGEWALIATKDTANPAANFATGIRRGTYQAFRPAGHFEAASHGPEVYVRYIGGGS